MDLTEQQQEILLKIARKSILAGCENGCSYTVDPDRYDGLLQNNGASFVTLKKEGQLRGCIGTLEPYQPLIQDVSQHAYDAAFSDPRFSGMQQDELPLISISVSVLLPAEAIAFSDEAELLNKIRPGIDGLIIEEGNYRGTFLPSVWESLPEKADFLRQLKRKAGLPENYWSERIQLSRYQTVEFTES